MNSASSFGLTVFGDKLFKEYLNLDVEWEDGAVAKKTLCKIGMKVTPNELRA